MRSGLGAGFASGAGAGAGLASALGAGFASGAGAGAGLASGFGAGFASGAGAGLASGLAAAFAGAGQVHEPFSAGQLQATEKRPSFRDFSIFGLGPDLEDGDALAGAFADHDARAGHAGRRGSLDRLVPFHAGETGFDALAAVGDAGEVGGKRPLRVELPPGAAGAVPAFESDLLQRTGPGRAERAEEQEKNCVLLRPHGVTSAKRR